MLHVLSITAPIYLLIALGYGVVKAGWLSGPEVRVLGRFTAQISLPALIFRSVSSRPLSEVVQLDYAAIYLLGSLVVLGLMVGRALWAGRRLDMAAFQGLGSANSNSAFVGYPLIEPVVGPMASVALVMHVLVENLFIVPLALALGAARQHRGEWQRVLRQTAVTLARTPMIVALAVGVVVTAVGLPLPGFLTRSMDLLGRSAAPVALFVIGGTLVGLRLQGIRTDILAVVVGKLVLHPLAIWGLLSLWPLATPALNVAAVMNAAMPMLSVYPVLALRFGLEQFCAAALLGATVVSFFTVSLLTAVVSHGWVGGVLHL